VFPEYDGLFIYYRYYSVYYRKLLFYSIIRNLFKADRKLVNPKEFIAFNNKKNVVYYVNHKNKTKINKTYIKQGKQPT
jgi:hypothetical protein